MAKSIESMAAAAMKAASIKRRQLRRKAA